MKKKADREELSEKKKAAKKGSARVAWLSCGLLFCFGVINSACVLQRVKYHNITKSIEKYKNKKKVAIQLHTVVCPSLGRSDLEKQNHHNITTKIALQHKDWPHTTLLTLLGDEETPVPVFEDFTIR